MKPVLDIRPGSPSTPAQDLILHEGAGTGSGFVPSARRTATAGGSFSQLLQSIMQATRVRGKQDNSLLTTFTKFSPLENS